MATYRDVTVAFEVAAVLGVVGVGQEAQPLLTHRIARRALRNEENPI
jgi:hypothetical protein